MSSSALLASPMSPRRKTRFQRTKKDALVQQAKPLHVSLKHRPRSGCPPDACQKQKDCEQYAYTNVDSLHHATPCVNSQLQVTASTLPQLRQHALPGRGRLDSMACIFQDTGHDGLRMSSQYPSNSSHRFLQQTRRNHLTSGSLWAWPGWQLLRCPANNMFGRPLDADQNHHLSCLGMLCQRGTHCLTPGQHVHCETERQCD